MIDLTTNREYSYPYGTNYTGPSGDIYPPPAYVLPHPPIIMTKEDHFNNKLFSQKDIKRSMRNNHSVSLLVEKKNLYSSKIAISVMPMEPLKNYKGTDAKFKLHQFTEGLKSLILAEGSIGKQKFISEFSKQIVLSRNSGQYSY